MPNSIWDLIAQRVGQAPWLPQALGAFAQAGGPAPQAGPPLGSPTQGLVRPEQFYNQLQQYIQSHPFTARGYSEGEVPDQNSIRNMINARTQQQVPDTAIMDELMRGNRIPIGYAPYFAPQAQ